MFYQVVWNQILAEAASLRTKYAPSLWLKMKIKCITIYFLLSFLFLGERQRLLSGMMEAVHKVPLSMRNADLDLTWIINMLTKLQQHVWHQWSFVLEHLQKLLKHFWL